MQYLSLQMHIIKLFNSLITEDKIDSEVGYG